ncbi:MAG: 3-mercaptopyruvate sulfurtransferase [Bosea sp. (in: a-proteobacteria)]
MSRADIFVTTEWLAANLGRPGLVIVDGSYYLSTMNRDAAAEFAAGHIPGAIRFDIDAVKDMTNPLPHMLPGAAEFAEKVGAMGIADDMTIIVYDGMGLFSAPRVRWTFRTFGAKDVRILDGGYPQWLVEGRATESGPARLRAAARFNAAFDASAVASTGDVKAALASRSAQVVDARPAGRFAGTDPEPRPGLSSGHMPGSVNLPFATIIENGQLKDEAALASAFAGAGVDLDKPVITSCGSGVSAAILSTAMELVGKPPKALYDGSWAEWASAPGAEIIIDKP